MFVIFGINDLFHSCFDEFDEPEFRIKRVDEFFDIIHDGLCIEVVGDATAHSPNCFKCVLQCFEWRGVELGSIVNDVGEARASVETFCVCCCEFLQGFVNLERMGFPEVL